MSQARIKSVPKLPNLLLTPLAYSAQLALCAWHRLKGYTRPGNDPVQHIERSVNYDFRVVRCWEDYLSSWGEQHFSYQGLRVLELGPGAGLGTGLILLAQGAASYQAVDLNPLAHRAGPAFYAQLFQELHAQKIDPQRIEELQVELEKFRNDNSECLKFLCPTDFDLASLGRKCFDLIVSQAAVEHFDHAQRTIQQLSDLVAPGGVLILQVDLMTHTPWLRNIDPLSIYRIPRLLYKYSSYSGIPNRVRPNEFKNFLVQNGWDQVSVVPTLLLEPEYVQRTRTWLAPEFRGEQTQMEIMSVMIMARRLVTKN